MFVPISPKDSHGTRNTIHKGRSVEELRGIGHKEVDEHGYTW